jgi:hypothetical protein
MTDDSSLVISPNHILCRDHDEGGGELAAVGPKEARVEPKKSEPEIEEWICKEVTEERVSKSLFDPAQPTSRQIDDHDRTHLPYRSWCKWCVEAKGREDAHSRVQTDDGGLPVVGMEYVYYGNTSKADEDADEKKGSVLITKDAKSGVIFGDVCEHKGVSDDWIIKRTERRIESLGRRDIALKTDGEPALIQVQSKILEKRAGQTLPVNPPVYIPESNGVIENGAQDGVAHVRCLKLALESRLEREVEASHPIMEWVLVHACFLLSRYSVGHYGKTPYKRLTGHSWR